MRIADLMVDGKGLFHYMNEVETLPFAEAFDIETLDKMFIAMYGGRTLSTTVASVVLHGGVNPDNMNSVAKMLLVTYGLAWDRLYQLMTSEIPLETYSMMTTETIAGSETTRHETTSENIRQDLDKVSGYNSPDMVEDSSKDVESTDNILNEGSREDERTRRKEVKGIQGSKVLEAERMKRFLEKNFILDVVFPNVATFTGSLIF